MTIHLYNVRWRTLLLRLRTSRTTIQLSYMNAKTYIQDPTMTVPLVRCSALPMFEGHPLIVTAQLEASQRMFEKSCQIQVHRMWYGLHPGPGWINNAHQTGRR